MTINTHNLRIEFGKHKGELWTRVPVSYLKWLVNTPSTFPLSPRMQNAAAPAVDIAKAELERRGTFTPTVEVSGHAIDRASLSCRKTWHQTAKDDQEGLHAWLCRVAAESLATVPVPELTAMGADVSVEHLGMRFVFIFGECWPVLKTVMRAKRGADGESEAEDASS